MLIYIIIISSSSFKIPSIFSNYEKKINFFTAPGALGPLMILAEDEKSDLSQVATSHLIRLIIIITVFPFIVDSFYDYENIKISQEIIKNQKISNLILLIIFSIIFIVIFDKFKIPAALLSGTLFASGFLQISEIASFQIPSNIIDYCY